MDYLLSIRDWITGLLWPARCAGCGTIGVPACRPCLRMCIPPATQRCPGCVRPSRMGLPCGACRDRTHLDRLVAATAFGPTSEPLIHAFKYRSVRELAAPLAERMCDLVVRTPSAAGLLATCPIVVPVPLHAGRQRERGFNQAELLARRFAGITALPVRTDLLVRIRATRQQAKGSRTDRRENMLDAFSATDATGLRILLIDDVTTTGATLEDCARALKEGGAVSVAALTFARG